MSTSQRPPALAAFAQLDEVPLSVDSDALERGGRPAREAFATLQRARRHKAAAADALVAADRRMSQMQVWLLAEQSRRDRHRHLPVWLVALGIPCLAALEVPAAEPAAEAFGLGQELTLGITALTVGAVIVAAVLVSTSAGSRRRAYVAVTIAALAVLWGLRVRYVLAFDPGVVGAVLGATGLTLITVVVFGVSHELVRRVEPLSLWRARRAARQAEQRWEQADEDFRQAEAELRKAMDAWQTFANRGRSETNT